ncbi:hypothetical protein ABS315_11295 [Peribacillus frigoritolerans]|uniref:hypothetical protein n=1 Tax=Peribacillus frigoritolerans TaxID=450367 RepID=UPI0034E08E22
MANENNPPAFIKIHGKLINSEFSRNNIGNIDRSLIEADEIEGFKFVENKISNMPTPQFNQFRDEFKTELLKEVEAILSESKAGKSNSKLDNLIQFVSSTGSAALVEVFKAYGIVPSK